MQQKWLFLWRGDLDQAFWGCDVHFFYYLILERLAFTTIHIPPGGILAIVDTSRVSVIILQHLDLGSLERCCFNFFGGCRLFYAVDTSGFPMQDGHGLLAQVHPKYVTVGSMYRLEKMQSVIDQQVKSKTGHDMG